MSKATREAVTLSVRRIFFSAISHMTALGLGFAAGIYWLPIWTAPASPSLEEVRGTFQEALFEGTFRRDLTDSDALHWGEGKLSVGTRRIAFQGRLAPGPDYKLYLSPQFVETEEAFHRLKPMMVRVGDIKTFDQFILEVPLHIDPRLYNTAIVWCETFSQFITSASYR
jgi:hypothetical protein